MNATNYDNPLLSETPGTRNKLVEAGREAFFQKGYLRSSLRQICASCDLTTGAFYFLFKSKDELFTSILEPVVEAWRKLAGALRTEEDAGTLTVSEADRKIMGFLLSNRKEVLILVENSDGSPLEGVRAEMLSDIMGLYRSFFARDLGNTPKDSVIRLIIEPRLRMAVSLLREEREEDETEFLISVMAEYAEGGYNKLVEALKRSIA